MTKRSSFILMLLAALAAAPLSAQKTRPAAGGPDADGDGITDASDRCPSTLPNTRVGRDGCPLTIAAPGAPAAAPAAPRDSGAAAQVTGGKRRPGALMGAPSGRADSAAAPTAPAGPAAAPTGAQNAPAQPANPVVTPQAAPGTPSAAPPSNAFTAGLAAQPFAGSTAREAMTYAGRMAPALDSTIVRLVSVFRNTSGQPVSGALDPTSLSGREKDRWTQCRNLYWDLTTFRSSFRPALELLEEADATPAVSQAAQALDSALDAAFADTAALAECDNVSSMITAPARWSPWDQQYQAAARRFYAGWYPAVRNAHDRHRSFVIALNAAQPAAQRIAVPPALQRNPPYAGAGPR